MIAVIWGNGAMMKITVNTSVYDWSKSRKYKEKRCRHAEKYGTHAQPYDDDDFENRQRPVNDCGCLSRDCGLSLLGGTWKITSGRNWIANGPAVTGTPTDRECQGSTVCALDTLYECPVGISQRDGRVTDDWESDWRFWTLGARSGLIRTLSWRVKGRVLVHD